MQYFVRGITTAVLLASVTAAADAQSRKPASSRPASSSTSSSSDGSWLKAPVFVFQPGVQTVNAISPTNSDAEAKSYANLRFVTVIPTSSRWFNLAAGLGFTPNGPRVGGVKLNQPSFFYGAIVPVSPVVERTNGWVALSFNPLGNYAMGGGGARNEGVYGHDFVLQTAIAFNVGAKLWADKGHWSQAGVYLMFDQKLTNNKSLDQNGNLKNDRWNPTLLWGIGLPAAPWGR